MGMDSRLVSKRDRVIEAFKDAIEPVSSAETISFIAKLEEYENALFYYAGVKAIGEIEQLSPPDFGVYDG